jgi:hypothetical protein
LPISATRHSGGRLQADNRGIIGRVFVDDGERSFGGWFVAVKRE